MSAECRPPEGTKDYTLHVLTRNEPHQVSHQVARYVDHIWLRCGSSDHWSEQQLANLGWRYSHAIDLSPPVETISDEKLAHALCEASILDRCGSTFLSVARKARELLQGGTAPAPAAPDPLQPLRDAVVEEAMEMWRVCGEEMLDGLYNACEALNAAEAPPDPVAELRAAWEDVRATGGISSSYEAMEAAIAALEAGRVKT